MPEAPKKKTAAKKTTAKKTATKKAPSASAPAATEPTAKTPVSPMERWRMVAEAAYYRAQERGFVGGNPYEDWVEAEKEIDSKYAMDFSKVLTLPNASEVVEQLKKALTTRQFAQLDLDAVLDSHRKNVEALVEANKVAFEGTKSLLSRQVEALKDSVQEAASAAKTLAGSGTNPKELVSKQTDLLKQSIEKSIANMREAVDGVAKSNNQAFNVINRRFDENMAEIRSLIAQLKK